MLEPVGAAAIEALVHGLKDKVLECAHALPHRHVDDDAWIGIGPRVGGITAVVDIAPDEAWAALGEAIHQSQVVGEIRHPWIVEVVADATDIQFGKMMIGGLLQGPAPWLET